MMRASGSPGAVLLWAGDGEWETVERPRGRRRTNANSTNGPEADRSKVPGSNYARPRQLVLQPDELDRQIITLLRADGRRSNREIARRLGVPEATVRYRVRRLTESGVLRITASVDPEHLGYLLTSVISVQVEPRQLVAASDSIAAMPEVMWLAISAGASDVILTASFHNQEEMFTFITERLAHVPGVSRTETSVCMKVVKKSHQWAIDLTSALSAGTEGQFAREDAEPYVVADALMASDG